MPIYPFNHPSSPCSTSIQALVLAAGWGERHPLAGCSIHGNRLLPSGFVMVYAPREESDVATVLEIVKAGGWWVGGVDLGAKKCLG